MFSLQNTSVDYHFIVHYCSKIWVMVVVSSEAEEFDLEKKLKILKGNLPYPLPNTPHSR